MAGETVLGRCVLSHLLETARACHPSQPITVYSWPDDHQALQRAIGAQRLVEFRAGDPPQDVAILRADRLYDRSRLTRVLKRNLDLECAVTWRLDQPRGLELASAELTRRQCYQPLGRFWALGPARGLARWLAPTRVHPNAVTLSAAIAMLAASAIVVGGSIGPAAHLATAALLAVALVLDTADGHLARLQGTASDYGRWLDGILDELSDLALHAAIAWSLFAHANESIWLLLGLGYVSGKYLFVAAQDHAPPAPESAVARAASTRPLARIVRLVGHADVRWHAWILLAAAGRLEVALVVYAVYFPLRTIAISVRRTVRRD
jgi:phosphatidylglycerophosphate synthase